MGITWKDLVATLLAAGIGVMYYTPFGKTALPFLNNNRWSIVLLALVGIVMCSLGTPGTGPMKDPWIIIAAGLGILSFVVVIIGLITGAKLTVQILVILIFALWLLSTLRHLFQR